jgi:WD40 repeat protein
LCEKKIISGSYDGEIRIWCLERKRCIQTVNAHSDAIREIQVLSDKLVASCSIDKTIKIWDQDAAETLKSEK